MFRVWHYLGVAVGCLFVCAPLHATIFAEITYHGYPPDGHDSQVGIGPSQLDVYLWSSQPDVSLIFVNLDIVAGQNDPCGLYTGTADPLNLWPYSWDGTVEYPHIRGIQAFDIPPSYTLVPLPTTPQDALLIYDGFWACFNIATRFDAAVGTGGILTTDGPVFSVESFGVFEIPEPSSLALLSLGAAAIFRRSRP